MCQKKGQVYHHLLTLPQHLQGQIRVRTQLILSYIYLVSFMFLKCFCWLKPAVQHLLLRLRLPLSLSGHRPTFAQMWLSFMVDVCAPSQAKLQFHGVLLWHLRLPQPSSGLMPECCGVFINQFRRNCNHRWQNTVIFCSRFSFTHLLSRISDYMIPGFEATRLRRAAASFHRPFRSQYL